MLLLLKTLKGLRSKFKLLSILSKSKLRYEGLDDIVLAHLSNLTSQHFLTSSRIPFAASWTCEYVSHLFPFPCFTFSILFHPSTLCFTCFCFSANCTLNFLSDLDVIALLSPFSILAKSLNAGLAPETD